MTYYQHNPPKTIQSLTDEHIRELCDLHRFELALKLVQTEKINAFKLQGSHLIQAEVMDRKTYHVHIDLQLETLECNCQDYLTCEHIIACLIKAKQTTRKVKEIVVNPYTLLMELKQETIVENILRFKDRNVKDLLEELIGERQQTLLKADARKKINQLWKAFIKKPIIKNYKSLCQYDQFFPLEQQERLTKVNKLGLPINDFLEILFFESLTLEALEALTISSVSLEEKITLFQTYFLKRQWENEESENFLYLLAKHCISNVGQVDIEFLYYLTELPNFLYENGSQKRLLLHGFFKQIPIEHPIFNQYHEIAVTKRFN